MKVKFVPQNVELEIKPNQSVMHLAHDNGIHIKSVCKGIPSCAECRVRIVEGEHNVLPPNNAELSLIGTAYFVDRRRLSCQLKCFGDIVVDLGEQIEKAEQVAKRPRGRAVKPDEEESHAVAGTLVLEDDLANVEIVQGPASDSRGGRVHGRDSRPNPPPKPAPGQKPKKDFYSGFSSGGEKPSGGRGAAAKQGSDGSRTRGGNQDGPARRGGPQNSNQVGESQGGGGRNRRRRRR